jgi:hypothetical protein
MPRKQWLLSKIRVSLLKLLRQSKPPLKKEQTLPKKLRTLLLKPLNRKKQLPDSLTTLISEPQSSRENQSRGCFRAPFAACINGHPLLIRTEDRSQSFEYVRVAKLGFPEPIDSSGSHRRLLSLRKI